MPLETGRLPSVTRGVVYAIRYPSYLFPRHPRSEATATMEVSGPMDLVPQAEMSPRAHPETLMRSNTTSKRQRALPAGIPGLPHPNQRGRRTQPRATLSDTPPETTSIKTNPWKLTREFDEFLAPNQDPELIYREPPIQQNLESYRQEPNQDNEPPQQLQPDERRSMDTMANQRGTLNITYDPNWPRQQQPHPKTQAPSDRPANRFDLGYMDKKPQAVVSQQETGPGSPEESPYQTDWIAAATQDITDRNYYDADAAGASAYTHHAVAVRAAAPTMIHYSASTDEEFERPRQVPSINPRSTRIIVKEDIDFLLAVRDGTEPPPPPPTKARGLPTLSEAAEEHKGRRSPESVHQDAFVRQQDVDFYLSLLAGSDPPAASPETRTLVQEEEEMRRRSEAAAAQEAEKRRREELQTNQNDLDFLAALLQ